MASTKWGIGAKVNHPKYGEGIITGIDLETYQIFFRDNGDIDIARDYEGLELIEDAKEPDNSITIEDVEEVVGNVLQEYADFTPTIQMGDRWEEGTMTLQPGNPDLKPKEVPIKNFFYKITMVRERLRVLEQQINKNENLSEEEKINLQQYITRSYGSLTTFNVLFKYKEDQFKGEKK